MSEDKRKRNLTVEQVKEHLDNIERFAKFHTAYSSMSHDESLAYSKRLIIDAFKELKGER